MKINATFRLQSILICLLATCLAAFAQTAVVSKTTFYSDSLQAWAYDIKLDNKLYIRQQFLPGVEGYIRFSSQEKADKVATLVVSKLNAGNSFPAITRKELVDLGVVE